MTLKFNVFLKKSIFNNFNMITMIIFLIIIPYKILL